MMRGVATDCTPSPLGDVREKPASCKWCRRPTFAVDLRCARCRATRGPGGWSLDQTEREREEDAVAESRES